MSQFRNLVFEGGGVKGIAYAGALRELEAQGIMADITRVAGTSAGAITAVLVALGATAKNVEEIVGGTDFSAFMDGPWGVIGDAKRVVTDYGVYEGDAFANWMKKQVYTFSGDPNLTFRQMALMNSAKSQFKELHVVGTNLSMQLPLVLSLEHTPDCALWFAARISMSIPLFFMAVRDTGDNQLWVDGGVTWNYPIDLFDDKKFAPAANAFVIPDYTRYDENTVYNKETLGFRLDTRDQIQAEKDHWKSPPVSIQNLLDYAKVLVGFMNDMANRLHLHQNDWDRTIFIDTGSVGATQFNLSTADANMLISAGQTGVQQYFKWFNDPASQPKPLNKV